MMNHHSLREDLAMKTTRFLLLCLASMSGSGCATITSNEMQPVSLTTKAATGEIVEKAKCSLRNDKGVWETESPAFVNIRRSSADLLVECKKDGHPDGFVRAISRAAAGMFGNIIFGGGIGALIDHSKGTGYNYPESLPVKMGASVVIDRKDEAQPSSTHSEPARAPVSTAN
jgi:hypothetical protein